MHETGSRTFWLREILVRKGYQRRGYAHRLHDALLSQRPEERAALFVRIDNPARLLYKRWAWSVVGYLPPQGDSPRFEAMLLPLPNVGDRANEDDDQDQ
jgi:ribosomal protein S18 acetylase RimI-like enzyme